MSASVTDAGLVIDTQASAYAELTARLRQLFDTDLVLTEDSDLGKILIVFAEASVSNQQFLSTVADTLDVFNATGVQLIVLGALNGIAPLPATRSQIALQLTGTGGLAVGDKRVRYKPTGAVFRTPVGAEIPASGVLNVTGVGETTGPLIALEAASSDWVIVDGVTGWDSVESLADVDPLGRAAESQEEFRARVVQAGQGNGAATEPAVQEELSNTSGVASLRLLNNRSPIIDADGVAGFHVEAILSGGSDEDIGATLLDVLGATTPTQGTDSVTITDPFDGELVTFRFSRLSIVRIILRITIDETGAQLPRDVDAVERVTNAAVAYIDELDDGINVVPAVVAAEALAVLTPGSATSATGEAARFGGLLSAATVPILARERTVIFGSPQPATIASTNFETFNLTAGWNIDVAIDNGQVISVTFFPSQFVIISAATAVEIAAVFTTAFTALAQPGTALAVGGQVVLQSQTTGVNSSVNILVSSNAAALAELGFVVGLQTGTETDIEVVFTP